MNDPVEVAVSVARKVNLGNYESIDIFFALSNVRADTTDEELLETLQAGDRAYEVVRTAVINRMAEIKEAQ